MTPPRTLGATAKVVLESVEQDLVVINDALFGAVEVMATDQTRAIGLLNRAASRNTYALRALTLLRADRLRDAETVIIEITRRRPPALAGGGSRDFSFPHLRNQDDCAILKGMKLIAQVKLQPAPGQTELLRRTLEVANAAANYVSEVAWETKTFRQYDLHHACYYDVRERYELSAQMTVRLLAKVADAYKLDRKTQRRFHPHGSIAYDNRILAWKLAAQTVSIWTVEGRQTIPFVAGERQLALLPFMQGEADLVYRRGEFYLHQVCEVDEPPVEDVDEFLGVDLGIVNIATDSDGTVHSSRAVNNVRYRHRRLRAKLQSKGTKSARRRLKKLAGKERRFAANTNHTISKRIVTAAKDTGRGIALEDLSGIRERVTARRAQRATLHSWSFFQLRSFVEYKARLAGVPVVAVDPRNTSRTCPTCGHIDKRNRPSQGTFSCVACGYSGLADHIAAVNISRRAAVNPPYVSDAPSAA